MNGLAGDFGEECWRLGLLFISVNGVFWQGDFDFEIFSVPTKSYFCHILALGLWLLYISDYVISFCNVEECCQIKWVLSVSQHHVHRDHTIIICLPLFPRQAGVNSSSWCYHDLLKCKGTSKISQCPERWDDSWDRTRELSRNSHSTENCNGFYFIFMFWGRNKKIILFSKPASVIK